MAHKACFVKNELNEIKIRWKSVFYEDFSNYEEGPFSEGYDAAREFYYPPKKVEQGPWEEISTYHTWNRRRNPDYPNWKIVRRNGIKVLNQTLHNPLTKKDFKYFVKKKFFRSRLPLLLSFPALATGEFLWKDYLLSVQLRSLSREDLAGIIFRMVDGQNHYILAFRKNRIYLLCRELNNIRTLYSSRYAFDPEQDYLLSVLVQGNHIRCYVNETMIIDAKDDFSPHGKVGLMANVPAFFSKVEVHLNPEKDYKIKNAKQALKKKYDDTNNNRQGMKLWRKLNVKNFCSGKSLRIGDLTGDGKTDLLFAQGRPLFPGNDNNGITCLTAVDLDGNILWQRGSPSTEKRLLHSDLAFQIYDIDGDGLNEVICANNFHLEILNGQDGQVKRRIPTPKSTVRSSELPHIIGDSIAICNISGNERPQDILIKDRYAKVWAYNHNLEPLWEYQSEREMGHFPYTMDINNDGRDEILIGYSLLRHDGQKLWEMPLRDHADAVAIVKDEVNDTYKVLIAASDEGFILADIAGRIERHLRLGHMQTVTVARLISDSPGLQIATNTYWGNPGIIYILDLRGNIIKRFQPSLFGSPLRPVSWFGNDCELLLLSAASDKTGGLYDGLGEQRVSFPEDGHPTLCYDAFDFDGDGYDELICWDFEELWIYTRRDKPADSKKSCVKRLPPLYNTSNYRAYVSIYS